MLFTEVLEEALVGSDPEGPLCELLFFFLSAIFQALAEEQEEVAKDQVAEADTKGQRCRGYNLFKRVYKEDNLKLGKVNFVI